MKKVCIACGGEFGLGEFYVHPAMADGHLGKCKSCCKEQATARRQNKLEEVRAYDRRRGKLPHRLKQNREYLAANPEKKRRYIKTYQQKYPEKAKAVRTLNNAVRDGRIQKQPCEVCGSKESQAHHDDYLKPLEVKWLCDSHHKERHRVLKGRA